MKFNRNLLLPAFYLIAFPIAAADVVNEDTEVQVNDENLIVTVASRTEEKSSELSLSVSAITANDLELLNHSHIQETINRIPGVNFHRGDGQEYLPSLRSQVFTGAGACGALLIMEDNIPLRPSGFCNINELFEANTELASQIEVIRGPGTVFYGSNALHGVVNIITPSPTPGGIASLELGENGLYRTSIRSGFIGEEQSLSLSAIGGRYEGWRDDSSFDQQKLAVRHEMNWKNWQINTGLSSTNLNQETAGFIVGEDAFKDPLVSRSNPNPEGYRDVQSFRLWSKFSKDYGNNETLSITPYIRNSDMNFMMHFLPGDPVEENGQNSFGFQTSYRFSLNDSSNITTGIDFESADTFLKQTQENPTQGSAFLQATIPAGKQYDYEVDSTVYSVFMNLEQKITAQLISGFGLRWESLEYDYTNLMNTGRLTENGEECGFGGCRYSRPASSRDSFDNWSADISLSNRLSDSSQVFTRLTRAFRAPQATELYRLQRDQVVADLDSENVTAFEIGYRYNLQSLLFEAVAYHMHKKNFIFRDVDFFNVSNGETKHIGLELQINYQWNNGWYWGFSGGYAEHKYDYEQIQNDININGNYIDTAPKLSLNNRFGWASDISRIELEWIHADDYYLEPTNRFSYEGHDLFHLLVSHKLNSSVDIKARVHNLFDESYAERADYTTFTAYRYFPGIPRQVSVTISYQW